MYTFSILVIADHEIVVVYESLESTPTNTYVFVSILIRGKYKIRPTIDS